MRRASEIRKDIIYFPDGTLAHCGRIRSCVSINFRMGNFAAKSLLAEHRVSPKVAETDSPMRPGRVVK